MKKKVVLLTFLIILTGCKSNLIECNKTETENEIIVNNTITTSTKNNKLINMRIISETIIPEKYLNQKQTLLETIKKQEKEIEDKYNITPQISEIDSGTRLEFNMTEEQIKEFYKSKNTITTTKKIIEEFTKQGYTCKKK